MKASARFLNESWCIDLAHVDSLARVNNGVKNLLIYKDLFERTLYAKGMKTKQSEIFQSFHMDLTRAVKKNLVSVDITRLTLMFRKASSIHF